MRHKEYNDFSDQMLEHEIDKIMDRINQLELKPKRKRLFMKKIVLIPMFSLLAICLLIWNLLLLFNQDNTYDYFTIKQVHANQYSVSYYDDTFDFNIYTLINNPNTIEVKEGVFVYKDLNKYIDVSEKTTVNVIEINNYKFVHVKIDNRINRYYQVYITDTENSEIKNLFHLDYEFQNFYNQMNQLAQYLKTYPPIREEVPLPDYSHSSHYLSYRVNPDATILSSEDYALYEWYIDQLDRMTKSVALNDYSDLKAFSVTLYMDGTESDLGEISSSTHNFYHGIPASQTNYYNLSSYPVKLTNCQLINRVTLETGNFEDDIKYQFFIGSTEQCQNTIYDNQGYMGARITFNKIEHLKLEDYSIDIFVNNEKVETNHFYTYKNTLIILPIWTPYDEENRVTFNIQITIKDSEGNYVGKFVTYCTSLSFQDLGVKS